MLEYKAPVRDISFVMNEVLEAEKLFQTLPGYEEATTDLMNAITEEGAKFCEGVLAPLYQSGDKEGCTWSEDGVKTPAGFKEAYQQFVENGWPSLAADVEHGGQGMPNLVSIVNTEMWTGTMCLTESHCGSDLGLLRTKAEPQADGSYAITGTKIFISAGEHDMADNIVHIVLARLPDAPAGTKGISLFIVPKFNVNADGSLGERNAVHCASIEKKMGIKATPPA